MNTIITENSKGEKPFPKLMITQTGNIWLVGDVIRQGSDLRHAVCLNVGLKNANADNTIGKFKQLLLRPSDKDFDGVITIKD